MMDTMSAEEFLEWMVLEKVEPFGERGEYIRAGIIAATIANVNRDPKKTPAYKPSDFIPDFDKDERPTQEQTPEQMLAYLDLLAVRQDHLEKRDGSPSGNRTTREQTEKAAPVRSRKRTDRGAPRSG